MVLTEIQTALTHSFTSYKPGLNEYLQTDESYWNCSNIYVAISFAKLGDKPKIPDQVLFYYGDVNYFSEDGKIPYGGTQSLIKRVVSASNSNIIEELVQPPRAAGQPAFQSITTITRVDATNVLVATDDAH